MQVDRGVLLQAFLYKHDTRQTCLLKVDSPFVRSLVKSFFKQRVLEWKVDTKRNKDIKYDLQFCEYEEIDWDRVLMGDTRSRACCYCVRKGMTRKAAW